MGSREQHIQEERPWYKWSNMIMQPRHRGRRRPRRLHAQTPPSRHPRRLGRTEKRIWLPVANQVPQSQIFERNFVFSLKNGEQMAVMAL